MIELPMRIGGGPMIGMDCRHRISVRLLTFSLGRGLGGGQHADAGHAVALSLSSSAICSSFAATIGQSAFEMSDQTMRGPSGQMMFWPISTSPGCGRSWSSTSSEM